VPIVTLLTDWGLSDPYAGEVKAVLLRFAPGAAIVDVTHGIAPGAIREGAWVLARTWRLFPPGTCHVAVVDPGVGGGRRGLAARGAGHFFVGPDNGLLAPALESCGDAEWREVAVREIDHPRRGTTFDGRDVFAPVAARLAQGEELASVGPEVHDPVSVPPFRPTPREGGTFDLEIVRADRFGNLVTVAEESFLRETFGEAWRDVAVRVGDATIRGVRLGYEEVDRGLALLTIGGAGTLEISVNQGSARKQLRVGPGGRVRLEGPGAA
jgi:S-adenosylmethionine hydrolase